MRWRSAFLALLLMPGAAYATSQGKLEKTQAELKQTRAKAEALSSELKNTEKELRSLRGDVTQVARTIQQREAALTQSERKLRELTEEVANGEERLRMREAEMQRAMLAMLQIERLPAAAMFAQPGNAQDTVRTAAALDVARSALEHDADELKMEIASLKSNREALIRSKERYSKDAAALAARRTALTSQLAKRSALQAKLSTHYQQAESDTKRLAREAESLQQLINELNRTPTTKPAAIPARGKPTTPVAGNVVHRFGERKSESETWRGMMFRTRPSALVVAPAGGEVAFTGPFMNYGPMVLLRHQDGMMSLVAGLGRIDVRLKQNVVAGEPLGIMPATAGQNLYVELREHSKPIDPERWFATVGASLGR